jgi:hypothetical protein
MKKMSEKGRARVENAYTIQLMVFFFYFFKLAACCWIALTGCLILQKKSSNRILSRDWMYKKGKGSCNKMGEVRFEKK